MILKINLRKYDLSEDYLKQLNIFLEAKLKLNIWKKKKKKNQILKTILIYI